MFLILFIISVCLWAWCRRQSKLEPPVMSGSYPIVGHALEGLGNGVQIYKVIERMSKESQDVGGVFRAYFGPVMLYGITDPDDALTVGNVSLRKHFIYNVAKVWFKDGLLTADVPTWKKNRKLLEAAFTPQVLASLVDTFNDQARKLVANFANEEGKMFDHDALIRMNTLDTVCIANLGTNAQEFRYLREKFVPHWKETLKIIDERSRKAWLSSDLLFNMTSLKKKQDKHVEITSNLAKSILDKKLKNMQNADIAGIETNHPNTFITTLLNLVRDGHFTREDILGEIQTLIAAGHDTSASTISIALTYLGSHPDVQEKAYQEIRQVLGDTDRDITKEDLLNLTYLDAVIKETLRVCPIAPVIGRELETDVKIKNYTLKANQGCFISLYGILHDKIWGPDRHEFRPDRWLDKDSLPNPKYFAAFGLGRRFCIGKQYAMITMKITLAHVLRRYKITSDVTKMVIKSSLIISPDSGYEISIQKRS